MKKAVLISLLIIFSQSSIYAWGKTGHRVVGEIAWQHLSNKAKKNVQKVLGNESLSMCGNWMDFIKSDRSYDTLSPWHYCTIHDGKSYAEEGPSEKGDAIMAIRKFEEELRTSNFSVDELFALKCLVHLVADIHQPLHCGNGTDRGGNDLKLEFFGKSSNLHRVWDSNIIDSQDLSFSEYAAWTNHGTKDQISKWQKDDLLVWVEESRNLHPQVYSIPENKRLGYRYIYENIDSLNMRLLQAGVRLAAILNKVYG